MFVFCRIGNTNLICYRNGTILRQNIRSKIWKICKGSIAQGYLRIKINKKHLSFHRIIAHAFGISNLHSELQIDHRDRNRLNNCIFNLRPATHQQNQFNRDAKGYYFHRNKFEAYINVDGNRIYLGSFDTEEEAKHAYLEAKKMYHKLNA